MADMEKWCRNLVKGRIVAHVARGSDNLSALIKATRTVMRRNNLGQETLEGIFAEVKIESVEPFLGAAWNQPERAERFVSLKSALLG